MAKLIYTAITSLDGYIEDGQGRFDWAAPDHEVHAFVNEQQRPIGTYLFGRRMYDTLVYWETEGAGPEHAAVSREYASIWRAAEKIVYSRTLKEPRSERTRIEREFDPAAVRRLKESAATDISIGGANLAAEAMAAGLVDELGLFLNPVLVGGGKPALPDGVRARLDLLEEHRFGGSGVVYVRYAVRGSA